ncbi:ECF transporter S component [Tissierellaceae bacterium HCP3S3_D8]
MNSKSMFDVRRMTIIGVLGAISIVLGMTPLGFIPVGATRATIMHIPVIIGAIMEGPVVGGIIGLIFGGFSIFQAITNPTPVSFAFYNPMVSILPRVLVGITTYYTYTGIKKIGNRNTILILDLLWASIIVYLSYGIYESVVNSYGFWIIMMNVMLIIIALIFIYFTTTKVSNNSLDLIISTIVGTLTNTVGVLGMIYLFHGKKFVTTLGMNPDTVGKVIIGIGLTNGIPEAIIAIIIVVSVMGALRLRDTK